MVWEVPRYASITTPLADEVELRYQIVPEVTAHCDRYIDSGLFRCGFEFAVWNEYDHMDVIEITHFGRRRRFILIKEVLPFGAVPHIESLIRGIRETLRRDHKLVEIAKLPLHEQIGLRFMRAAFERVGCQLDA